MKSLYFSGIFIFASVIVYAQIHDTQWEKCLTGCGIEQMNSLQQATGGRFIVTGISLLNDGGVSVNSELYNYGIARPDINGNAVCQKSIGGDRGTIAFDSANKSTQLFPP